MKTKPYVICHMITSLDGKITGDWLTSGEYGAYVNKIYMDMEPSYKCDAWLVGRVTMEKDFTFGHKPNLDDHSPISREDFVAVKGASNYAVAVDQSGKLGWEVNNIDGVHVIEVLNESVSDAYLNYLRKQNVSYIFGGKDSLDLNVVLEKLNVLFNVKRLLLEGGGFINGSFINEGLIDELNIMLVPVVDGTTKGLSLFEIGTNLTKNPIARPKLDNIVKRDDDIILLRYKF